MSRKATFILAILALAGVLGYVTRDHWLPTVKGWVPGQEKVAEQPNLPTLPDSEVGKTFSIKRISVLKGDHFDITTRDGKRVLCRLTVMATNESKSKVLDLFNHCADPRVVLKSKQPDGHWTVEILFKYNGNETKLSEWLTANKLVYQQ